MSQLHIAYLQGQGSVCSPPGLSDIQNVLRFLADTMSVPGSHLVGIAGPTISEPRTSYKNPHVSCLRFKNLLAEICHFNNQKYDNLFSQAKLSRFLHEGYGYI